MSLNRTAFCLILILGLTGHIARGIFFFSRPQAKTITIMLDPAGDSQHTGRKLEDNFERGVSLQIAERLKKKLEDQFDNVKIVLTRLPGESATYLQHASFANRLEVDFYLSIGCYHEKKPKPSIYIYQFSYSNEFITKQFDLALIPYDQAHLANNTKTSSLITLMNNILASDAYANAYTTKGIFKIPFKPLIGIQAPAAALELGLKNKNDWQEYVNPISQSLIAVIEKLS